MMCDVRREEVERMLSTEIDVATSAPPAACEAEARRRGVGRGLYLRN